MLAEQPATLAARRQRPSVRLAAIIAHVWQSGRGSFCPITPLFIHRRSERKTVSASVSQCSLLRWKTILAGAPCLDTARLVRSPFRCSPSGAA